MRRTFTFFLSAIASIALTLPMASCGGDEEDEPDYKEETLVVSPSNLQLPSDDVTTVHFNITAEPKQSWVIGGVPDWLFISATTGTGSNTVDIRALSTNVSSSARSCTLSVSSGSELQTVTVSQLPGLQSNCAIHYSNILTLCNSVAFDIAADGNVSYFYCGYLEKAAAGWTDKKIVDTLIDKFEAKNAEDLDEYYWGYKELDDDTEYYLCAVAFDEKGNQGELTKQQIKTPRDRNSDPIVTISKVQYDDEYWYWNTTKNSYTTAYYTHYWQGSLARSIATVYVALGDAVAASIFKALYIDEEDPTPASNDTRWKGARSQGVTDLVIMTWGLDNKGELSPKIDIFGGSISDDSRSGSTDVMGNISTQFVEDKGLVRISKEAARALFSKAQKSN